MSERPTFPRVEEKDTPPSGFDSQFDVIIGGEALSFGYRFSQRTDGRRIILKGEYLGSRNLKSSFDDRRIWETAARRGTEALQLAVEHVQKTYPDLQIQIEPEVLEITRKFVAWDTRNLPEFNPEGAEGQHAIIVETIESGSLKAEMPLSTVNYHYKIGPQEVNVKVGATRPQRTSGSDEDRHEDNLHAVNAIWNHLGQGLNYLKNKPEISGKKIVVQLETSLLFYVGLPGSIIKNVDQLNENCQTCESTWTIDEDTRPLPWSQKPGTRQKTVYNCACEPCVEIEF